MSDTWKILNAYALLLPWQEYRANQKGQAFKVMVTLLPAQPETAPWPLYTNVHVLQGKVGKTARPSLSWLPLCTKIGWSFHHIENMFNLINCLEGQRYLQLKALFTSNNGLYTLFFFNGWTQNSLRYFPRYQILSINMLYSFKEFTHCVFFYMLKNEGQSSWYHFKYSLFEIKLDLQISLCLLMFVQKNDNAILSMSV